MIISPKQMRKDLLKMAFHAKSMGAHLGGSLSLVEIIACMYGKVLKLNKDNLEDDLRDRFILSKGHGVMALYAAYRQLGIFSEDDLTTYKSSNSLLSAHPVKNKKLGIEFSSGSLGQGLSLAVGTALGLIKKGNTSPDVFVVLGDGECNEGSVWEAAASASFFKLHNLTVIIDNNKLQYDGPTECILSMQSLEEKLKAFGFEVISSDGHSIPELQSALTTTHNAPLAIIANTVKGKGVSFMENNPSWHNGILSQKLFDDAIRELEAQND